VAGAAQGRELILLLALAERAGELDQAVGQRGFAVIDVGDDAEVADVVERSHDRQ
jgi:hypothetical protein